MHPDLLDAYWGEATFLRRFTLSEAAAHYPVRIAAMRRFEVTVDGRPLPTATSHNWKFPVPYDLGPALHAGENEIRIRVFAPEAPPALLVEGPDAVRSDERWSVSLPVESGIESPAAVAYRGERFLTSIPSALRSSRWFRAWAWTLVAYCLFIGYALIPIRTKPWMASTSAVPGESAPFWRSRAPSLALLAVVATVHLRNAYVYPPGQGFDAEAHADYVRYVADRWRVPVASDGWEMSQPPLYYVASAGIYRAFGGAARETAALKAVQLFSPVMALATVVLTGWMLAVLYPAHPRMRRLGFAVAALLPVLFYMSPQVTNEMFAAFVIGCAICVGTSAVARGELRWRDAVAVGGACGLGLLSKYTGVFVFLSVLGLAGLRVVTGGARPRSRLRQLAWTTVLAGTTLAISGWLYARNVERFGTPFIGAWDRRSGFDIVQPPGYRAAAFYGHFGAVFWQQIGQSRDTSFWDGMYGSLWGDSHGTFLERFDERASTLSSVCLWLALLPSVAMLLGFGQALAHVMTREWDHPYFILVVTTALTVAGLLSFTMEHPWYSTLKAHWALSLTPCAGVFAALGLETMCRQLGRLRWAVYTNLGVLGGLVLYLFWYRGP